MAGYISLPADYGRDRENGEMVMPLREKLGLPGSMSLALEDRLCHLAATSRSYKHAAQTAEKFGIPVDAVRLRRLVQCAGKRALQQEERRISEAFDSRGNKAMARAAEHLWTLARSLHGEEGDMARKWAEPLLSGLKYRGGGDLLSFLEELTRTGTERLTDGQREVLRRETAYFQKHKDHLNYPGASLLGLPLGSGEMESACFQLQGRFKRPGQFWSQSGEQNLMALEMALRNGDWDRIWGQIA